MIASMGFDKATARILTLLEAGHEDTWARVARAVEEEHGNTTAVARALGVSYRSFLRWRQSLPRLEAAVVQARSRVRSKCRTCSAGEPAETIALSVPCGAIVATP